MESGQDINQIPGSSTFRRNSNGGHGAEVKLGYTASAEDENVFHTAQAEVWRILSRAANDLPPRYPRRGFLVDVADCGELAAAGRRHRLSPWSAERALRKFCTGLGVDYSRLFRAVVPPNREEPAPPPGPVRRLSRAEIKRLTYTPPRSRK